MGGTANRSTRPSCRSSKPGQNGPPNVFIRTPLDSALFKDVSLTNAKFANVSLARAKFDDIDFSNP